ncbi:MAG: hypothetical protein F9K34_00995 [Albidovulum sp.]|uniref:hypothetical protein n=1 Tax=Albidovulum sp. TaxID=1872424 RepID=UPI0013253BE2|nr:hypothetical protein [Defluviimonas sp.]KAB2886834.1 MAG: hypothetical protein F9K34_00995 [Defluviimonas sp.]
MTNALVDFWSGFQRGEAPHVHPDDEEFLRKIGKTLPQVEARNFHSFIRGNDFGKRDGRLHVSLLPAPYLGDLERADIFVLLLNPGVAPHSYLEQTDRRYLRMWENTVRQRLAGEEFPNHSIDPRNAWSGAYHWWEKKFRSIAAKLVETKAQPNYYSALREISRRVAAIELCPYHSVSRPDLGLIGQLPSTDAARKFLKQDLLPRAREARAIILVTRSSKHWSDCFPGNRDGVYVYDQGQARSASFSHKFDGKAPIEQRLCPP